MSLSKVTDKNNERDALYISMRDGLQLSVYSSEFVGLCQSLLRLCSELKQGYMLHDFELLQSLNQEQLRQNMSRETQLCQLMFVAPNSSGGGGSGQASTTTTLTAGGDLLRRETQQEMFTQLEQMIDLVQLKKIKLKQASSNGDVN